MSIDTFAKSKQEIVDRALGSIDSVHAFATLSVREAVARACQVLYVNGHSSGLSGQITARGEDPGTYWTQPMSMGLDDISGDNLILVDENLNVLQGGGMPNPANRFHSWLYRARPDVNCIVHSHASYTAALSMLEVPLIISHMDTCLLYEQTAFLPKWPGIPVGNEEGELISKALGNKKAILLAHHGLLVAGASVEEACVLAVQFEQAAKMQLIASASGVIREIPTELGIEAQRWLLTPRRAQIDFAYLSRNAERRIKTM